MTGMTPVVDPPRRKPNTPRKRNRRGFWRRFLFLVVLLIVITTAAFMGWTGTSLADMLRVFSNGADIMASRITHAPAFAGQQHINILMLGADVSTDNSGECRTDTIKLISVDMAKSDLSILSIPRDTWVDIPEHGHSRINAAYQLGGRNDANRLAMAKSVISGTLGGFYGQPIHIDRYIRVQTGGFVRIVNALGGIDVNVEKQMDYEDPSQNLYIHLKPGVQHLDGTQAMGYVRFRHDFEGDYGRIRRQDQFLRTVADKLRNPNDKAQLARLLGPLLSMMKTDLSGSEILALKQVADKVGMSGIHSATLPTVPTTKGAASVVEVEDPDAAAQVISEVLNGPRPTVTVLNGSGQSGLARAVGEQIDTHTYNVVATGTTTQPVSSSTVIAAPLCKKEAESLATLLGVQQVTTQGAIPAASFGKKTPQPPPTEITVVLGSNYTPVPAVSQRASR